MKRFYFRRLSRQTVGEFRGAAWSQRKFHRFSTDFLNRSESWIYERMRYQITFRLERRAGVIRFNYQTCGRAGTLEETLMKFQMNVCARWANTGIKLMTYAANTRRTRKYELFLAWSRVRSFLGKFNGE